MSDSLLNIDSGVNTIENLSFADIEDIQNQINTLRGVIANQQIIIHNLTTKCDILEKTKLTKFNDYVIDKHGRMKPISRFRKFVLKFIFKTDYYKELSF